MLTKKNPKKMHKNVNKCQAENCTHLPGQYLIFICNRRDKSVPAGRVEILSRKAGIMESLPKSQTKICERI